MSRGSWAQRSGEHRGACSAGAVGRASRRLSWAHRAAQSAGKRCGTAACRAARRRGIPGQGTWRADRARAGALQIRSGSSIKAGAGTATVLCSSRQGCSGPARIRLSREILVPGLLAAALTQLTVTGEQSPAASPSSLGEPSSTHGHANAAFWPSRVLEGVGKDTALQEDTQASVGNVSCCRRRARTECGPWLMQGTWGFPSLGTCVAITAL